MKQARSWALLTVLALSPGPFVFAGDSAKRVNEAGEGANRPTALVPNPTEPSLGEQVFWQNCSTCHGAGTEGAPPIGDAERWKNRIAQGLDVLVQHAINGHRGPSGYMPPKGGFDSLSDEEVAAAVVYVVEQGRKLLPQLEPLSRKCGTRERTVVCSDAEARKLLVLKMLWQMLGRPR